MVIADTTSRQQEAAVRIRQSIQLERILSSFDHSDTGTGLGRNPSWDDVLDCIQKGKEAYTAKGITNPVRGLAREGKDVAQTLDSLAHLIPDEKGLSTLKWGLSFIFQIWIHRIENAGRIIEVLGDIPHLFSRLLKMCESYPKDNQLRFLAEDCCETALGSLTKLMTILLRVRKKVANEKAETKLRALQDGANKAAKRIGTAVKDIGKQIINADAESIQDVICNLNKSMARVYNRVDELDRQLQTDTNKSVQADLRATEAVRRTVNAIGCTVSDIPNKIKDIELSLGKQIQETRTLSPDTKAYLDQVLSHAMERERENVRELIQENFGPSCRGFFDTTAESERKRRWQPGSHRYPPPIRLNYRTVPLTTHQLLQMLNIDHSLPTRDEQNILRQSHSMRPEALSHACRLLSTEAFQNWFIRPGSNVLVANGHCGDMAIGRISPLSVFCASLAASLCQSQFIVLHFYCGQHTNPRDKDSGPRALMRSLISQLLLSLKKPDPALGFMEESLYHGLGSHNPVALVHVFEELLRHVDVTGTIFCIIDSVSELERNSCGWSDTNVIIDNLLRIIRTSDGLPAMKLLLTSANRSRMAQKVNNLEQVSLMALWEGSRPLPGRVFDQDVRQLITSMPPRSTSRLRPNGSRTIGTPLSRHNFNNQESPFQERAAQQV